MRVSFSGILGKKVLIIGEAGSGKTTLLVRILEDAVESGFSKEITVIDMAPRMVGGIGGRLADITELTRKVRLLMPEEVYTPRLSGQTRDEVLSLAEENKRNIEPLLEEFIRRPSKILFVNDLSICLHRGDVHLLERCITLSQTFVGTAYHGRRLQDDKGSGITERERELLKK